jgi:hypothetical protein
MTDRIRILKHEAIPGRGSYEVRIEGQASRYFYFDDLPGRRRREYLPLLASTEPVGPSITGAILSLSIYESSVACTTILKARSRTIAS